MLLLFFLFDKWLTHKRARVCKIYKTSTYNTTTTTTITGKQVHSIEIKAVLVVQAQSLSINNASEEEFIQQYLDFINQEEVTIKCIRYLCLIYRTAISLPPRGLRGAVVVATGL